MPRVKISYGVELDHVPEEVQNLFVSVYNSSETLVIQAEMVQDLLDSEELQAAEGLMTKMRKTMGDMDARIADLSSVLVGYNNYMEQSGAENEQQPPEGRPVMGTPSSDAVPRSEESHGSDDESVA
tara:strand:- start:158 stop:535 length:378 start_codon:yes stop_codon:yes gene_type:complete